MDNIAKAFAMGDLTSVLKAIRSPDGVLLVPEAAAALRWAINARDHVAVSKLLGAGVDPNWRGDAVALVLAAYEGDTAIVDLLLDSCALPNLSDVDGQTPLMSAAKGGHLQILKRLISAGADPAHTDAEGRSALHWAMLEHDNPAVCTALLDAGSSLHVRAQTGLTPLDYAARLKRVLTLEAIQRRAAAR